MTHAATQDAACSPEQLAANCNQCFYSDQNIYLGYDRSAMGDTWIT
jgi:hypothetical protein